MREPAVVGKSAVTKMSLCAIGTPASGGASPAAMRASAARAWASVTSSSTATKAPSAWCGVDARQEVLRGLDRRNLARAQRLGELGHAQSAVRVLRRAHSITFGTRNRPLSTAGALRWLASRLFGSLATSSAQPQRDVLDGGHRMRQGLDAGGVDRAHALDQIEEAVDLAEHALAFVGGQLQPRERGDAGDIGDVRDIGKWTKSEHDRGCDRDARNGCAATRGISRGFGYYPAFAATPANAPAFAAKTIQSTPSERPRKRATTCRRACRAPEDSTHVRSFPSVLFDRPRDRPRHRQHPDLRPQQGHRAGRAVRRRDPPRRRPARQEGDPGRRPRSQGHARQGARQHRGDPPDEGRRDRRLHRSPSR